MKATTTKKNPSDLKGTDCSASIHYWETTEEEGSHGDTPWGNVAS